MTRDLSYYFPVLLFWILFNLFVVAMLVLDLGVLNRRSHRVGFREALIWSGVWIALAGRLDAQDLVGGASAAGLAAVVGFFVSQKGRALPSLRRRDARLNLIHMVVCLSVAQSATDIFILELGYRSGGHAPVFAGLPARPRPTVDAIVQASPSPTWSSEPP